MVHGYIRQPPANNPQVVQLEPSPFSDVQRDLIALRPLGRYTQIDLDRGLEVIKLFSCSTQLSTNLSCS